MAEFAAEVMAFKAISTACDIIHIFSKPMSLYSPQGLRNFNNLWQHCIFLAVLCVNKKTADIDSLFIYTEQLYKKHSCQLFFSWGTLRGLRGACMHI